MSEHSDQSTTKAGTNPARIDLEDFIEAVSRGVARALAAQEEVSGYALRPVQGGGRGVPGTGGPFGSPFVIGLIYYPPGSGGGTLDPLGRTPVQGQV